MRKTMHLLLFLICGLASLPGLAYADTCTMDDRACVLEDLSNAAAQVAETPWRDQTYRDLAKTFASGNQIDRALTYIDKIETPDTKAMTIRGIGMAAADLHLTHAEYDVLFTKLRAEAEKITHPPSYAIALTYIAMGQAFAGENEGAWATAASMENDALRHKAYGETAEIQAEKGDFAAAMKSVGFIGSPAYRNKAYGHVSQLLADHGALQESYEAAQAITNPYQKATAIQYVLDIQNPREVSQK